MRRPAPAPPRLAALALALAVAATGARRAEPPRVPELRAAERARTVGEAACVARAESPDSAAAGRALDEALDGLERLAALLVPADGASELSRLNAAGPEARVTCSADLFEALALAFALARETEGAYDPTVDPLLRAWDVRGSGRRPEPSELRAARDATGWTQVLLDAGVRTVRFPRPGMGLDLGALAPGFALDRAVDRLRARGVKRALLELDGEVAAFSDPGPAWTVAVRAPAGGGAPAVWLAVRQGAVSTASPLERAVTVGGVPVGRVFDARTGQPVAGEASVTVVTRSAARAAALATALLVLGRERAQRLAESRRDLGVLWLEPDGSTVRAWRWNLPAAQPDPRAVVRWMD
jgi:thiamine biosynthesis lipoprotein